MTYNWIDSIISISGKEREDGFIMTQKKALRLGIDVGSTTVKTIVMEVPSNKVLFTRYERHHAEQGKTVQRLLQEVAKAFPGETFRVAICGS
ncbi:MAG: hypothetical protein II993_04880, partial [Anaerotignum sp.]|nr:hypothetical protein [Anaerotignum sp.]